MGRWRDNVFVERLWQSPKYDEVYLYAYETVADAQQEAFAEYLTLLRNSFEAELARLWQETEREAIELCAVAAERVIRDA